MVFNSGHTFFRTDMFWDASTVPQYRQMYALDPSGTRSTAVCSHCLRRILVWCLLPSSSCPAADAGDGPASDLEAPAVSSLFAVMPLQAPHCVEMAPVGILPDTDVRSWASKATTTSYSRWARIALLTLMFDITCGHGKISSGILWCIVVLNYVRMAADF
jgi:hypothetical protein